MLAAPGAVATVVVLVYLPVLGYGFVYDDYHLCYRVPWGDVARAFVGPWDKHGIESPYYRPLVVVSHAIDARVYGTNAMGCHLTNVLLHVGVVLLVYRLLRQLAFSPGVAGTACLAIGLSPLAVPTVAWISERTDSLAALFSILACSLYLSYRQTHRRSLYFSALVAVVLALGSKETAGVLPLMIILMDVVLTKCGRHGLPPLGRLAGEWAPLLLLLAAYGSICGMLLDPGRSIGESARKPLTALLAYVRLTSAAWFPGLALRSRWLMANAAFPLKPPLAWGQAALYFAAFGAALWFAWRARTKGESPGTSLLPLGISSTVVACLPLVLRWDFRLLYLPTCFVAIGYAELIRLGLSARSRARYLATAAWACVIVSHLSTTIAYRPIFSEGSAHMANLDMRVCRRWYGRLAREQQQVLAEKLARYAAGLEETLRDSDDREQMGRPSPRWCVERGRRCHMRGLCCLDDGAKPWLERAIREFEQALRSGARGEVSRQARCGIRDARQELAWLGAPPTPLGGAAHPSASSASSASPGSARSP